MAATGAKSDGAADAAVRNLTGACRVRRRWWIPGCGQGHPRLETPLLAQRLLERECEPSLEILHFLRRELS